MNMNDATKSIIENIHISNIVNKETFSYSLILLNGSVTNSLPNTLIIEHQEHKWETIIKNNHFKCLIKLNLGKNTLLIRHGYEIKNLTIFYSPRKTNLTVIPLYIVCDGHDGNFQAPESENNSPESACKRITLGTLLIQSFIAETLNNKNMGRKSFHLESECIIFNSKLNYKEAKKLNSKDLWNFLAIEIMSSNLSNDNRKYMAFLSCTTYDGSRFSESVKTYNDLVELTDGYVALGGGGLALYGTACLYTWPECVEEIVRRFENEVPVDRVKFMDDSSYRGTLGACFSTTLGSALHELCHTFNLGHTEHGIMGRDFGNIYKFFMTNTDSNKALYQNERKKHNNVNAKLYKLGDRHIEVNRKDEIDWSESCAVFLSYHRWFNDSVEAEHIFQYDHKSKFIKSTAGIRVVEIRNLNNDEMVIAYWTFTQQVLKYSFCLPDDIFQLESKSVLVAEDNVGNILKEVLS